MVTKGKFVSSLQNDSRLAVARHAAQLFLERGFSGTSGDDIAEACGLSKRTIWRYFRNKESCVAPLFALSWQRFAQLLQRWPRTVSIETHLESCLEIATYPPEQLADGYLIIRMIATLTDEPDLRSTWLLSYHEGEEQMMAIIADRLDRSRNDFEVRLCAAAVMAAIRTVDETISLAAVRYSQSFSTAEVVAQLSRAIRALSNLPFCDPCEPRPFGLPAVEDQQDS
jgi:AcrR family transcriptional regulator